jgi:imidazolonepropionase-like amidohydrolase
MDIAFRLLLLSLSTAAAFPTVAHAGQTVALTGATVYPSPEAAPIRDAVVVLSGTTISAIGQRGAIKIPAGSQVIDCSGRSIVAGFWNSHAHLTEAAWNGAATAPVADLQKHMEEMLTRWGFTTVWDLGSDTANSLALRHRIEAGDIKGPRFILTGSIFPLHGHPVYLPSQMQLPEAATPQQAEALATRYMTIHMEGIKLFTGAFMGNAPVINMPADVAKAAVDVAHSHGLPVFTHPQNRIGLDNALVGGVDVLAHTIPDTAGFAYSADELSRFQKQRTALIPTLTLWTTVTDDSAVAEKLVASGVAQVHAFAANGGPVLFGTDAGFMNHYDTAQELEFMGRALSAREVLASLTTTPSTYFKAVHNGRVEVGFDADLVVLEGEPTDVRNLAKVAYTIRAGQIIYQRR